MVIIIIIIIIIIRLADSQGIEKKKLSKLIFRMWAEEGWNGLK